ncbi:MAG: universal stress protein [Polyangiaceae bacterium]|nr:universal stress protein [Polyangiaceae bacterium]
MRELFLCATDATPASLPAIRLALKLAKNSGASLVLLHVVPVLDEGLGWYVPSSRTERQNYKRLLERYVAGATQRVRQQLHRAGGAEVNAWVKVLVKSGAVVQTVLETAMDQDASLVVVGRGRNTGVIAPTAERIARLSSRPVVLVPARWARGARVRMLRRQPKQRRPAVRAAS